MLKEKALFRDIIRKYFDMGLEPQVQVFNLLGLVGAAAGVIVAAISVAQRAGVWTVALNLTISAMAVALLGVVGKRLSFRLCCWITVVAVFLVAFAAFFFSSGGYRGGMPSFFIFALIYTAMLLEGRDRAIALALEFSLYIGCFLMAYFHPETVRPFASEAHYFSDVVTGAVVAGLLLMLVTILHIRMYAVREAQIRELNRELAARNEALVKYDRMKSDFLAAVAHEISRPLTVIAGSSADTIELLRENTGGVPDHFDEIMENHELIGRKVMLLDGMITDLMDTAAMETGRLSLSRQRIQMSELLRRVGDARFRRADAPRNRVLYDMEENLPPLWVDPGRMEQVVDNLLSNADRHTRDGVITIRLTRADRRQVVSVMDTGEGMEPGMAESVMKMYVTSRGERWRHGYGLYICRQIIVSHGGDIWVESEKGRGTTVSFALTEEGHD